MSSNAGEGGNESKKKNVIHDNWQNSYWKNFKSLKITIYLFNINQIFLLYFLNQGFLKPTQLYLFIAVSRKKEF